MIPSALMGTDLEGITVIAVEQAVAAPLATCRLADAGARVIKVERSDGDFARHYDNFVNGQSAYFVWLNRGKESICLDIKVPADQRLLERMIAKADVFVQNLRPGLLAWAAPNYRSDTRGSLSVRSPGSVKAVRERI